MRLSETRDQFVTEFSFPVEHGTVVDAMGGIELDAPHGEPESIGEVLGRTDDNPTYRSADELYDALVGSLGEGYIGRKHYDDRGPNPQETDDVHF
jgi:hypothetical protein